MSIIVFRMSTKNNHRNAVSTVSKKQPGQQYIVGAKQIRKALLVGKLHQVFLAEDADPAMTVPLEELCRQNGVACSWVSSMTELGHACGIDVGAAAAAVAN